MKKYKVIGLMSGTSLDGLDVALCAFYKMKAKWYYKIIQAQTYPYTDAWIKTLATLHTKDALTFVRTDVAFAELMAKNVLNFCATYPAEYDFIASHGHTIFHAPHEGYTTQIGAGAVLAARTKKMVISDFRSLDVALGGQGAPLVPVGDVLLFNDFDYCVNLGGFANISFNAHNQRIAFDICPANIILNFLYNKYKDAQKLKGTYDAEGKIAANGTLDKTLFDKLNKLAFYRKKYPKSLGREWLETAFNPEINNVSVPLQDIMHTVTHHIAFQIARVLNKEQGQSVLFTGGGTYNLFLMGLIKQYAPEKNIIIPDKNTIEFKEALIFAFLGLLRYLGETNTLKSVTGSSDDSCGGCIYSP